jgi:peptidyl-prolyl cis-trans isomerase D
MVQPFSDSCFYDQEGNVKQVQTQFGIHLLQVTEKSSNVKKLKVAYLTRNIEPSSETYREIYSQAVKFAGLNNTYEKFNQAIAAENLTKRYASDVSESQKTITGLDNPRPLIRWAYEADLHEVTPEIFEFGNKYVIAVVTGIREKGIAPLEQVRAEIELEVRKEKKAEKIISNLEEAMASADNIEDLGLSVGLPVQPASNINFSSLSIPGAGIEPSIIAASSTLQPDQLSQPLKGNNGVYVIVVTNVMEEEETNLADIRQNMSIQRQSQVSFEAWNALQEAADIKDNRAKFF